MLPTLCRRESHNIGDFETGGQTNVCVCVCVHGIVFVSMHVWVVVRVHAQMLRVSSLSVPGPYSAFLMSRHPASRYFKEKQERCNQSKQTLWLLLLLSVAVCLKHLIYSCGNLPAVISIKNTIKAVFSLLKSTSSFILQPCSRQGKRPRGLSATRIRRAALPVIFPPPWSSKQLSRCP